MKLVALISTFLFAISLQAQQPTPKMTFEFDHTYSAFNSLLSKNVVMKKNGQKSIVNYKGISSGEINSVVAQMLKADKDQVLNKFSYAQRLSYFVNLYNALTIKLIKDNYKKVKSKGNSIKSIGNIFKSTWKKKFFKLFGKERSLDEVEHGFIRGDLSGFKFVKYKDPRIHFAVNCASKGCPALLNTAFTSANLESLMKKAMIAFLKDKDRNHVKGKTVHLSSIFKWYEKDFKKGLKGYKSLKGFVMMNADHIAKDPKELALIKSGKFDIDYTDYDWTLNDSI